MYGYFQYLLFMLPVIILSAIAQSMVNSRFKKFTKVASKRGITGAEAARVVLNAGGVYNVEIGSISGNLTDNYNPKTNRISLSEPIYNSTSVAAIGVAAHEAGHALQYANGYSPMKLRAAIIPVCNIGSRIGPLLIIAGCVLSYTATSLSQLGVQIYLLGLVLFGAVALFQLVTLPVELNASKRAMKALESGALLDGEELSGAKKVLTAAAMTYIAALLTAVMQIFYYASRFRPNNKK